MELEHNFRVKIDDGTGLAGLAIVLVAIVGLVLGCVGLSAWMGNKSGGSEVAVDISARHGFD